MKVLGDWLKVNIFCYYWWNKIMGNYVIFICVVGKNLYVKGRI